MVRDHILGWYERLRPLGPALRSTPEQAPDTSVEDFERGDHTEHVEQPEPDLPDGVWEAGPGIYKACCRSCGNNYELCYDPQDFTEDGNYCGGSDRCIP